MLKEITDEHTFTDEPSLKENAQPEIDFRLIIDEKEHQNYRQDLSLIFAVLEIEEVSTLKLYSNQDGDKPKYDFVLRRRDCLLCHNISELSFRI